MFFERFNVAGFSILERPIAQIYAANALHGVVVDIGARYTDVTPIYDGFPLHHARASTPLGVYHCLEYLAAVLRSNNSIVNALSPPESPLSPEKLHETLVDLARHIYHQGLIKAPAVSGSAATTGEAEDDEVTDIASILVAGKERAVIEANIKKRANQKASPAEQAKLREIEALDLVTVEFGGKQLTVGKERHRFCDPLFDPRALRNLPGLQPSRDDKPMLSISEVAGHSLARTDVDQRQYMLGSPHAAGGVLFTGEVTSHVKGSWPFSYLRLILIKHPKDLGRSSLFCSADILSRILSSRS
jgi:actin-related protein 9